MSKESYRTTWTHIRRAPYQSLAALAVMTLTFFVLSVFVLTAFGSHTILRYFETRPQVTAFFKDEIKMAEIDVLKAKLAERGKVKEMKYISKEEALEIYREQNKKDPLLLEMVTANILPASLEVSAKDISYLDEIAEVLKSDSKVEEVIFQQDVVKSLQKWTKTLRLGGAILVGSLILVSFLIILVIIGIKVALRKEEVKILSLIGASGWYIRLPFILEGVFYGSVGAILGWGLSYILLLYSTPFLVSFLSGIPLFPVRFIFMICLLAAEILIGGLIGILGSLVAVRRYFK